MNGVEILSQTNIYEIDGYWWIMAVIVGVGVINGLVFAIKEWIDCGFDWAVLLIFTLCSTAGVVLGILGFGWSVHETDTVDYIEYKVIISEDVSFVEFTNKYEVLDQEGQIYTVRERE